MSTSETPPPQPRSDKLKPLRVLIDVGITYGLTCLGGVVIGIASAMAHQPRSMLVIGASNIIFSVIGFAIAGYFTTENRWRHLLCVAGGLWLTGLPNLALGITFLQWFFGIVVILFAMAIGGGLASLVKNKNA